METMEKKEHYRRSLPHFQQPGQAYFVTWCLKDSVPSKALARYTRELLLLNARIESATKGRNTSAIVEQLQSELYSTRRMYMTAFNDLLDTQTNPKVDLSKPENTKILIETLSFFEGKRLANYAFCIMPNHVHWVFRLFDKDSTDRPVYLQDIMQSVKRFSANRINKTEGRTGPLWQKESFDTTIRNEKHLFAAIEYTLNNPVKARLVKNVEDWAGCRIFD